MATTSATTYPQAGSRSVASTHDVTTTVLCYTNLIVANVLAWINDGTAGRIATGIAIVIFGGSSVYLRIARVLDERRKDRERRDAGSLTARIRELEAENKRLRERSAP